MSWDNKDGGTSAFRPPAKQDSIIEEEDVITGAALRFINALFRCLAGKSAQPGVDELAILIQTIVAGRGIEKLDSTLALELL